MQTKRLPYLPVSGYRGGKQPTVESVTPVEKVAGASRRAMDEIDITPTKRLKTLTPSLSCSIKGKGKMFLETEEELKEEEGDQICGICLSEEGKAMIRGEIDSCDHYFCFVCIMEWSKVEFRCPMCKQRFGSIRREAVPGMFRREKLVRVPVRNQMSAASVDPYAEVTCSECQKSVDENLLLLCDLCDSAAHTYCVGLGTTVPEGDWFCTDCTISRSEHFKLENEESLKTSDSHKSFNDHIIRSPVSDSHKSFNDHIIRSSVSISDIVADEAFCGASHLSSDVHKTRIKPYSGGDSMASTESREQIKSQNLLKLSCPPTPKDKYSFTSCTGVSEQGARTLGHCRNVQGHIQRLRENWDKLRNGSLSFKMSFSDSGKIENKWERHDMKSRRPSQLSPSNPQQPAVVNSVPKDISRGAYSNDVEKAWKMLDAVKSIRKTREVKDSNPPASVERNSIKNDENRKSTVVIPVGKAHEHLVLFSTGSAVHQLSSQGNRRQHHIDCAMNKKSEEQKGPIHINSLKKSTICPQHDIGPSHCAAVSHGRKDQMSQKVLSEVVDVQNKTWSPSPMSGDLSSHSLSFENEKHFEKSNDKEKISKKRQAMDKGRGGSSSQYITSAKSEVQSLVKLNMKLQLIDRQLEVDRFKQVARAATHTILAACGLDHSKSNARPFPSVICRHSHRDQHLQWSHLMPTSCRQCFFSFVKDVVSSTISEKVAAGTPKK